MSKPNLIKTKVTREDLSKKALEISEEIHNFTKKFNTKVPVISLIGGLLGTTADYVVSYRGVFDKEELTILNDLLGVFYTITNVAPDVEPKESPYQ
ncbi:MAG: hypothetical protein E6L02_05255 [Thaumarchaeota archaeon]|nr:MAG: hypothetical protein E6L02_05255 [Nitrososphaerota archaeon]